MLVYLHGLGCAGSRDWPPVSESPALRDFASLWIDLLGFGRSPRGAEVDYSLSAQALRVAELLEPRPEPIALVGHSMGGALAVLVAERLVQAGRPPSAVILAEPNLRAEDATGSARVAAMLEGDFVAGWQRFLAQLDSPWYRESARLADPVAYHRSAVSLVDVGARMLPRFLALSVARRGYVLGGRSDVQTHETARIVAEGGVPVACVEKSGHNFSADDPAGLGEAIAELLGR